MAVPEEEMNKRQKIEEKRNQDENGQKIENLRLTKYLKEQKEFKPSFTGGKFQILKGGNLALCLNDHTISVLEIFTNQVLASHSQLNEDISTFSLSPNQQVLATANRNNLVRVYQMPFSDGEFDLEAFGKMECLNAMKTQNQLVVEMEFDPTSKFLAVGTSDSAIKIFDAIKGF